MPQIINTNVFSLNSQRNLNRSQSALQTSLQRLSSGLRINSAKDDAAGNAIATRMTTQIGGLNQAIRNANDGISVAQTAEGAMQEMVGSLNRMHDLAVQASSYNTDADRSSINQEVTQLIDELSRIVGQTRFNGQTLLTGGFSADIQVGASVGETINVSISNLSPTGLGVASSYSDISGLSNANLASTIAVQQTAATSGSATINGVSVASGMTSGVTSTNRIDAINATTASSGVTAFSYGNGLVGSQYTAAATTANVVDGITAGALTVNGVSIDSAAAAASATLVGDNLVAAINNKTGEHGVIAVNVASPDGATAADRAITLINTNGAAITVGTSTSADAGIAAFFSTGTTSVDAGENGAIVLNQALGANTVTFDGTATGLLLTGASSATDTVNDAPVNSQVVTSAASAQLAMLSFESALETLNSDRSVLGAKLNRFESLTRNLENVVENITAARSRIQDADFAMETANLTKNQILQQAGIAMVSQANSLPQTVLSLLQ